jgi:hypothetical protein
MTGHNISMIVTDLLGFSGLFNQIDSLPINNLNISFEGKIHKHQKKIMNL